MDFLNTEKHIIACPHCGKDVLDHMAVCPHCGGELSGYHQKDPEKYERTRRIIRIVLFALAGVIVVVLLLRNCGAN